MSQHPHLEQPLFHAIQAGRLPHSVLFSGADLGAAAAMAERAAAFVCLKTVDPAGLKDCPNFFALNGADQKVASFRAFFLDELYKAAFSQGQRVVLLLDAHALREECQNALLKTLEEPPKNTLFF